MLISHKLLRWLPYLLAPIAVLALGFLATQSPIARGLFALVSLVLVIGAIGIRLSPFGRLQPFAAAEFGVAVFAAGFLAWRDVLFGVELATWEPTPRPEIGAQDAVPAR